jgi:ferredoxin
MEQKLIIYYFTGTGNSQKVADWIAGEAMVQNLDCRKVDISKSERMAMASPDSKALVVFVSPIHGFNYPPVMMNFIARFPKGKNNVVLMNTRAGMLIGKWVTPGVTGIAFYLSMLLLWLKGYSIKALKPVDMPSNWISAHPGLNARTVRYIHEQCKIRVTKFAQKMLAGKKHFNALFEVWDILLLPISIGYYFIGRFMLAKTYYASADCNNCDVCIKGCPVNAIIKVDKRPFWTFRCESCMKCMGNCPSKAIETGHGYIFALALLFTTIVLGFFYLFFETFLLPIENRFLGILAESAFFILLLAIWYRIVHFLLRFRFMERLVVYTSLTKFKFWGRRYKALKDY